MFVRAGCNACFFGETTRHYPVRVKGRMSLRDGIWHGFAAPFFGANFSEQKVAISFTAFVSM